jgi:hypothetical protein
VDVDEKEDLMPNQEEVYSQINKCISVTHLQIVVAKEFILSQFNVDENLQTNAILQKFLVSVDAIAPEKVIIHQSIDSASTIKQVIQNISWRLAFSEAIWALVHTNFLIPLDGAIYTDEPSVSWTSVIQGGSGMSSGWNFKNCIYSFPIRLKAAWSQSHNNTYLNDPDIYLRKLNIENIHDDVEVALKDAILCFKAELYTPCLAMLTKAVEGSWVELGLALIKSRSEDQQQRLKKQFDILSSDFSSIAKIIRTVLDIYEKQDMFEDLSKKSKIKLEDLRNAVTWADCVRESRNVVHYGMKPILPNNFEIVATLLLAAPAHFKLVYKLITTASEEQGNV